MSEIIQGDNGTVIECVISDQNGIVDIRGTEVLFVIKTPTRRIEKQGNVTDGQQGKCEVVLVSGDVQDVGNHVFQANVKFSDGKQFTSNLQRFKVGAKL